MTTVSVDSILQSIQSLSPEAQRELISRLPAALQLAEEDLSWLALAGSAFEFWENPDDARYDEL